MICHPRIAARLFNTVLMVHPGKAAAALAGIGGRIVEGGVEISGAEPIAHVAFQHGRLPRMGTVGDRLGRAFDRAQRDPYDIVDGIAIIPIEGTLVHKGAWVESDSGETSYQGLQTQVIHAARNEKVRAIAFEIDSYGGEVSGAFETSDMIASLSKLKPTIAILSDCAFSAGYLMASAARQIIVPEQGGAGSIGVITMHIDMSKRLEANGIKVTILAAGAKKAEGNEFEPLPPEVAAEWQAELEDARNTFAGRVAKYRGDRLPKDQAMATEAGIFIGRDAIKAGLVDAVGHPSDAFQAFKKALNRA